ncbi:MAG: hypothetical protein J4O07_05240 [Chloroflexi bacterium]|nr:hypothetical protein [Chloroflexota bacterium]
MLKKVTSAVTISALAALSLVAIAGAAGNDYANFTIANGDPNEEGTTGQVRVQPALVVENPMLNIGAGDDNDKLSVVVSTDYTNFTIANGDPNEEGTTDQARVQSSPVDDDQDNDRTTRNGEKLNIGASDPAEQ